MSKLYVAHVCPRCGHIWTDKDLTNVKTFPPTWKMCKKCCKELNIDFDSQRPRKGRIQNTQKE